ncbi:MAG: hypothetical protein K2F93_09085 [Muribaculaceae bacterium]|nr:hypothetical protein [Muribaculaceae bacterium]
MKDIKVELFALCQGAHNLNGHLTVVNTMDEFVVSSFPARISFGLAIKLYVKAKVEGYKVLSVSIIDKSASIHATDREDFSFPEFKTSFHLDRLDKPSHINIAFNLQNVLFEKEGSYDIHLELDGKRLDDFAFEVTKE